MLWILHVYSHIIKPNQKIDVFTVTCLEKYGPVGQDDFFFFSFFFVGIDFSRSTNSLIFLLRIHILRAYNCIRNCLGIFQSGCFQQCCCGCCGV